MSIESHPEKEDLQLEEDDITWADIDNYGRLLAASEAGYLYIRIKTL